MTLGQMVRKYKELSRTSEYVSIGQVVNDLHQMQMHQRLLKVPKDER